MSRSIRCAGAFFAGAAGTALVLLTSLAGLVLALLVIVASGVVSSFSLATGTSVLFVLFVLFTVSSTGSTLSLNPESFAFFALDFFLAALVPVMTALISIMN